MADQPEPTSPLSANQQGDLTIASGGDTTVGGDVVAGDKNVTNITNIIPAAPGAPIKYATRTDYLAQIIDRHQDLEFVGIPELKDRQALHIEDVFIHLQAEVEKSLVATTLKDLGGEIVEFDAVTKTHIPVDPFIRHFSMNEVLREHQRLVILGDPGAGKTTLLKYITTVFAEAQSSKLGLNEDRLPIFIRLYDYIAKRPERSEKGFSLVDYLYVQAHENWHLVLEPGFFESELERGHCCVSLDGLDELGGAGLRREVTNAVASLANHYPRNRFIVTSRLVGYEEAPLDRREFVHHTILPFADDDIREFVKKWYAAREKDPASARERAEHLTKTIMGEPRIKSLAANPLMLTIIALVHRIEAELPNERVKLYDKCVTALVETWEKVKGLTVEGRERPYYKYRRRLLEQLAFWMHSQPGDPSTGSGGRAREVKEGDLELQLTRFLQENPKLRLGDDESARQEAHELIALAKSRTGLLIERGEGVYTFAHLTFQEYLAAGDIEHRYAHSIDRIWTVIQPRLHDPHWREVILLLLGSLNKFERHPTELVRRIFESADQYEEVLHRHVLLAGRALADHVEVDATLHAAIVSRLLQIIRSDWLGGEDALAVLGLMQGDVNVAEGLLDLACDKQIDIGLRSAAAAILGQLGYSRDEVVLSLLDLSCDKQVDIGVRSAAVQALGHLGHVSDKVTFSLIDLTYDKEEDVLVRSAAVRALGQLSQTAAPLNFLTAVASDRSLSDLIRGTAVQALGELRHATGEVLSVILELAQDKQVTEWLRRTAALALQQLGLTDEATAVLRELSKDEWEGSHVQHETPQPPVQLDEATETATSTLLELIRNQAASVSTRLDAVRVLARLAQHSDIAVSGLVDLIYDGQLGDWVRRDAAQALGQIGRATDNVLSALVAIVRDNDARIDVRSGAYRSLKALLGGVRE